jgi:hypothetical protein
MRISPFDQKLILIYGEFGCTVDPLTSRQGPGLWAQQLCS